MWVLAGAAAFAVEIALLFGGMSLCFRTGAVRRLPTIAFGVAMLAVQAFTFFGSPPPSGPAAAMTALAAYVLFAVIIGRMLENADLS